MSKRKGSVVWDFFKVNKNDLTKAVCSLCSESVARGGKTTRTFNTANMQRHLSSKHQKEYSNHVKESDSKQLFTEGSSNKPTTTSLLPNQPTLSESLKMKEPFSPDHKKAQQITKHIIEMIAVDLQPFSIVNDVGFQRLMSCMEPRYKIPSDKLFREELLQSAYEKVKVKVDLLLSHATSISCTTDVWTSKSLDAYLGVSAHWINDEFERKMVYLGVFEFNSTHTGTDIKNKLTEIFCEWKVQSKVHVVLRDNASNMISALRMANIPGLPCAIHSLQLVIKSGLLSQRGVTDAVSMAQRIVTHFKHSPLEMTRLHELQNQLGLPIHVLTQGVTTRWDSTYDMLTRILEQKSAVIAVIAERNPDLLLKPYQWELLAATCDVLQVFKEATLLLSLHDSSLSMVIPIYNTIRRHLQLCDHERGVGTMKSELLKKLEACHISECEFDINSSIATLLDPRYKASAFENETARELAENNLIQHVKGLILSSNSSRDVCPLMIIEHDCNSNTSNKKGAIFDMLGEFLSRPVQQQTVPSSQSHVNVDLHTALADDAETNANGIVRQYLTLPRKPVYYKPLHFWHEYSNPHLKKTAAKFLAPPPGSVDSERAFSTTGLMTKGCRNRLKPSKIQKLFFLAKALPLINYTY